MSTVLGIFRLIGRKIAGFFSLVSDSDLVSDTYPEVSRPTGPEAATQGMVTANLMGMGGGPGH